MLNVSFRIKRDKVEVWKQNVTITKVAVVTTKSLFGMCDGVVESDIDTGDHSLV